jgi:hypothetical protein
MAVRFAHARAGRFFWITPSLALAAIACMPRAGGAQESSRPTARIADHRFMESDLVPLPIPTTNLLTSLGAGGAPDVQVQLFENTPSATPRTVHGSLAYLTLNLGYQQAVNDWLAPWIDFGVSARMGANSVSLLSEGLSYQYTWELGWLMRIHQWKRSQLSATLNLWNSTWGFVELDQWARGVIDSGGVKPGNELYQEGLSLSGGGGLRYADAINPTLGWEAFAEGGVGEAPNRSTETSGYFRGGVMADLDLNATRRIPLGVALGYRYESFPGVEPNVKWHSNQAIFRIEYTAREAYAVAIESQVGSVPLSNGRTTVISQMKLVTRYYF